jgi:fatty acid desaturase
MQLTPKDVPCTCGHVTTLTTRKLMCIKCGKYVFYDEHERKAHRRLTLFVTAVLALALGFVAYFFVEMILEPLKLLME